MPQPLTFNYRHSIYPMEAKYHIPDADDANLHLEVRSTEQDEGSVVVCIETQGRTVNEKNALTAVRNTSSIGISQDEKFSIVAHLTQVGESDEKLIIENHREKRGVVIVRIGDLTRSVKATELIRAISGCSNFKHI